MQNAEHLDHALAEEFAGHAETIYRLKVSDPRFRQLMVDNHDLWIRINAIQSDASPADDDTLTRLEKQRLAILDHIAAAIRVAET